MLFKINTQIIDVLKNYSQTLLTNLHVILELSKLTRIWISVFLWIMLGEEHVSGIRFVLFLFDVHHFAGKVSLGIETNNLVDFIALFYLLKFPLELGIE